ncbi:hypothetical protein Acr_00g0087450 [Actinidia rufa]|uniref:DUF8003 domain-containing protein n=1 Tax=Actinidia rufa TaxID=165716 RepID=A0A7J0DWC9_9ERIC|nr:hypothetical protein Acr_00g0087450 [Actinidia rufa]
MRAPIYRARCENGAKSQRMGFTRIRVCIFGSGNEFVPPSMAPSSSHVFHILILLTLTSPNFLGFVSSSIDESPSDNDNDWFQYHGDYSPPSPPPPSPPPHPPSVSCEEDLKGVGSLDSVCELGYSLNFTEDVYIEGKGCLYILPGLKLGCLVEGCSILVNISGDFMLGLNSEIIAGTVFVEALNATLLDGSVINVTALAGDPPEQTSGTPAGIQGAGGGHGGRGASCVVDNTKLPEDVWGGDAYSWSSLGEPWSYGSKGGTTNREEDYGGKGGGRIGFDVKSCFEVHGSLLADGGDGGIKGGGGSGGSIYIKSPKMSGNGNLSASGGNGFAGGGGGRVSVNVFSRHDDPKFLVHGGRSYGCLGNSGAAGTFYDAVPRRLIVSNNNMSTDTDTLLLEFPNQPLWTNVYIRNHAKATVPLLWSRVQMVMVMQIVATSLLEASNLVVLREASVIHSNANLGVHGQGYLNLSGPGDVIEAQRLILSLFYSIKIGPGSVLRGPLENASSNYVTPRLYCELQDCPIELIHPPEDCNVNSSLSFTLEICRVEDIRVEGSIEGSVVHFHWVRAVVVPSSGAISASGLGCTGGVGKGRFLSNGLSGGGGHGGKGGSGYYNGSAIEGGDTYGNADLPCELGSGSGNDSLAGATSGGGIIVMGSLEHSLSSLSIRGSLRADGESFGENVRNQNGMISADIGPGGGSGGTILLFLHTLALGESSSISTVGGHGGPNSGGGGGGRIHFHWSDIPIGDEYLPIASVKGAIHIGGGIGRGQGYVGDNGTVTGKACPKGLYGIFCQECPVGTFKNVSGSARALCRDCPSHDLPHRAVYVSTRGGVADTPCPYKCISERYHMPHCYTALEELIYTFGGPWLFGFIFIILLVLLALVLSVARMKFVNADELPGLVPTRRGLQNRSFISIPGVLETSRTEESQTHVHRMYFMGPNTFSEPWHLAYSPPEEVKEIVYEDAFNTFVDEINALAAYQCGAGKRIYNAYVNLFDPNMIMLACGLAVHELCMKGLRYYSEFYGKWIAQDSKYSVMVELICVYYINRVMVVVAATSDLMLAYVDFFLGGDEKRADLPPHLHQRFPMSLLFGGDGSYMAPFSLHSDNILTNLMSQPTAFGYHQFGLIVHAVEDESVQPSVDRPDVSSLAEQQSRLLGAHWRKEVDLVTHKRAVGRILLAKNLQSLGEKKTLCYPLSFILRNTKPVGHQDLVGLVISILLLGDFSLVLLTLLQLYSISLLDLLLFLFILPLGILFPFPAGINALFSHGPRRPAGLARFYALWNIMSLINVIVAFVCGFVHYKTQSSPNKKHPNFQSWNFSMDESGWWLLPSGLVLCKLIQARLINYHVANLEIQDRTLYSNDPDMFWQS